MYREATWSREWERFTGEGGGSGAVIVHELGTARTIRRQRKRQSVRLEEQLGLSRPELQHALVLGLLGLRGGLPGQQGGRGGVAGVTLGNTH